MKKYKFTEAVDLSRAVFYDLNASKLRFNFRSLPSVNQMIFSAVENADIVKSKFPDFEIKLGIHREGIAELIINYE